MKFSHLESAERESVRAIRDRHYAELDRQAEEVQRRRAGEKSTSPETSEQAEASQTSDLEQLRERYKEVTGRPANARWSAQNIQQRLEKELSKESGDSEE